MWLADVPLCKRGGYYGNGNAFGCICVSESFLEEKEVDDGLG